MSFTQAFEVKNGANLAALLERFPHARVTPLITKAGEDTWRVEFGLEMPGPSQVPERDPHANRGYEIAIIDTLDRCEDYKESVVQIIAWLREAKLPYEYLESLYNSLKILE